jgi:hypothetical protein
MQDTYILDKIIEYLENGGTLTKENYETFIIEC